MVINSKSKRTTISIELDDVGAGQIIVDRDGRRLYAIHVPKEQLGVDEEPRQ